MRGGEAASPGDVFARMPKAELHLHLEGTITPETLWAMARRNHVALPVGTMEELKALYEFESFDKFLQLWLAMCACLRTAADYEQLVDGFVAECARQNIRYVEAHFTPHNHQKLGIGGRRALEIVTRRLQASEAAGGPVIRLITDISGECADESGPYTVELLEQEANPLIVALGLGGPEVGFPRSLFAPYFERARAAGYALVAHAGETAGPEHVRQAVVDLKVARVQHGVRACEDDATLRLLAERQVCCDVALTSNECLKVVPQVRSHPLLRMLAAGVPVTLSTDDPPFFSTDLVREYQRAHAELALSPERLWQLNLNGLRSGLAETGTRRRLLLEFERAGRELGLAPPPAPGTGGQDSRFQSTKIHT
ncbi:MAG TPA: adenosine deaminase [Myxococcales bacterium]|nr:adenosine deaminase [Myxococcales bacterium]